MPTTEAAPAPITVVFGGDVHGEWPIANGLARGENPFAAVTATLSAADLAFVNLETTVGRAGEAQDKEFVFRSSPLLLSAAKEAGIDGVSLANNHSYDYGPAGFLETFTQVHDAGLVAIGAGMNKTEAYAPALFEVRQTMVAVVGIAKVGPSFGGIARADHPGTTNGYDDAAVVAAIAVAKTKAPIVIVFVHWGIEGAHCPRAAEIIQTSRWFAAGASAIVGAHPHVQQGIVSEDGHLVAYSLGDFVFYAQRPDALKSGLLTISFAPTGEVLGHTFDPARINPKTGTPALVDGTERTQALEELASYGRDGGCE